MVDSGRTYDYNLEKIAVLYGKYQLEAYKYG